SGDIELYLKDESTHASGSLKHRLARSLFLFALVNGQLRPGMPVIEASSGSTAVSEAHVARMLDIPFIAVIPRGTSTRKIALIEAAGGTCHVVDGAADMSRAAQHLAEERGGLFLDQFTHAERATDWRGNNSIAVSALSQMELEPPPVPRWIVGGARTGRQGAALRQHLAEERGGLFLDQFTHAERATDWRGNNSIAVSALSQMELEPHPVPRWIVVGAGTGGTSATFGRLLRYRRLPTSLCVADVENS